MQTTQDVVLHLERSRQVELDAFLDLKGLVLERREGVGGREVEDDGVAADRVHGKRQDDAVTGVVGVRKVFGSGDAESERLLVALERFIFGVWVV